MSYTLGKCIDCNVYINTNKDFNEHWRHYWLLLSVSKNVKLPFKNRVLNLLHKYVCKILGHKIIYHSYYNNEDSLCANEINKGIALKTYTCYRCLFYKTVPYEI